MLLAHLVRDAIGRKVGSPSGSGRNNTIIVPLDGDCDGFKLGSERLAKRVRNIGM
jgi:hypothetical protein